SSPKMTRVMPFSSSKRCEMPGWSIASFTSPDGQAIWDFLFCRGSGPHREGNQSYVLLLDIRMPKVNGVEVLRQMKADTELRKLPVIMLTTTDDPGEVRRCHELGCSVYIQKPVDYDKFSEAIRRLGLFIMLLQVPPVNGGK